jgi:hypothetical protein
MFFILSQSLKGIEECVIMNEPIRVGSGGSNGSNTPIIWGGLIRGNSK